MSITLEKIYTDFRAKEKLAKKLLEQMNWFGSITDFDPKTGAALPKSLSGFLAKVAQPEASEITRDRLWRITEHCRASVERLFHSLNESPRREHALLPVHAVRELDANSFIKLSNRPGRTIREKLAGNPYIQAVRRFQSVNLPENRLLKAFAIRLAEMLDLRGDCLGQEDELLSKIYLWLRSDEAQAIGNWENLPPNNTLLAHRDYRHVWDAWRWLQTLDEDITSDLSQLDVREKTMRLWQQCAQMWLDGKHLFAEIPLLFDYEKFEILPWTSKPPLFKEVKYKMPRHLRQSASAEPICVDITALHPRYASGDGKGAQSLAAPFLWQRWQRENETVDIELFGSDAVWLIPMRPPFLRQICFSPKTTPLSFLTPPPARSLLGYAKSSRTIHSSGLRLTFSTISSLKSSVATSTRVSRMPSRCREVWRPCSLKLTRPKSRARVTPSSSLIPLAARRPPPSSSPSATKTWRNVFPSPKAFIGSVARRLLSLARKQKG